jgi:hypothetical protein
MMSGDPGEFPMIGMSRAVALDAPDARRLAAFYTALGGWTEVYADPAGKPFCLCWD